MKQTSLYIRKGSSFAPTNRESLDIHPTLPAGVYLIKEDNNGNMYFDRTDDFPEITKLYGDIGQKADRILNTFQSRSGATGVLLTGEKGSGKTLLAKLLAIRAAAELNLPTILVNDPWVGEQFRALIQGLPEAVVIFDEFEKVYDRDAQPHALTLLDGVFPSKKLFILTCNNKYKLDDHLINRPGRIFYSLDYQGLDEVFIREYCADVLINKSHIDMILRASLMFESFNFDMLKALIEEMNRYDEGPYEALQMLNIRPSMDDGRYSVSLIIDGEAVPENKLDDDHVRGNPLSRATFSISYHHQEKGYSTINFIRNHLIDMSLDDGTYIFDNGAGAVAKLKRQSVTAYAPYSWMAM